MAAPSAADSPSRSWTSAAAEAPLDIAAPAWAEVAGDPSAEPPTPSWTGGAAENPAPSPSRPAACRGISWTPAETNALIAVWGDERLQDVLEGNLRNSHIFDRISQALREMGYERSANQCKERIKRKQELDSSSGEIKTGSGNPQQTLKRCYSRVKERGRGKRTCNYTFQQLEQVFGRVPVVWEPHAYQPVLIDSSGLYQDTKSDTINLDESREVQPTQLEDWGNQKPDLLIKQELLMNQKQELQAYQKQDLSVYQDADEDIEEMNFVKKKPPARHNSTENMQKPEILQALTALLDAVQPRWQEFQSYDDLSNTHFTNKLGIFAIGYNTRWVEDIRYHYAEISSQVLVGKRLKEYLNPDKPEGKVIAMKRQKMNWKKVYYKLFEITKSEARCLELHFAFEWIPIALSRAAGDNTIQYLLPGGIPDTNGLYVIGCEEAEGEVFSPRRDYGIRVLPRVSLRRDSGGATAGPSLLENELADSGEMKSKIRYCYLGLAEETTIRQCILQHFQPPVKMMSIETCTINSFLSENCRAGAISRSIYIKFIEVEKESLSAGCVLECLEKAMGYSLRFTK
ncbi:myb/SANT-like DNA-binding domain-containing protein 2 isoform X1 [Carcharodon carcharias]|uniref:myb/SANT-like DNA-binding domain-containing protein 2 isoform X1 n=1 Tax=Carcharodon carcharias TaxID=13397 RepID=UPI001B7DA32D|nr:myb/SANT-like DNA-binding domain-containing protein 2 isoform X1 [Carcharodon carcharias]